VNEGAAEALAKTIGQGLSARQQCFPKTGAHPEPCSGPVCGILLQKESPMGYLHPSAASTRNSFDDVLARVIGAEEQIIPDIVGGLPASQRAALAVFCYARAHLHHIGLTIAATCDRFALVQASPSDAAGNVLFELSRQQHKPEGAAPVSARPRVSLAKSASGNSGLAGIIARIAHDETADLQPA
jgi:hypothetical protein